MTKPKPKPPPALIPTAAAVAAATRGFTCSGNFVTVGLYYADKSTLGEFCFEWDTFGIKLTVFDDAWFALLRFSDLMLALAEHNAFSEQPSIEPATLCATLRALGITEIREQ